MDVVHHVWYWVRGLGMFIIIGGVVLYFARKYLVDKRFR